MRLAIYDAQGRLVRELVRSREADGSSSASWDGVGDDGTPVPSGVYFARLESAHGVSTRKILALR
jgi:flagellar hook assembly protein FlgD